MLFDTTDIAKPWPRTPQSTYVMQSGKERLTLPEIPLINSKTDKVKNSKQLEYLIRSYTFRNMHGVYQKPLEYHLLQKFEDRFPEIAKKFYKIVPKMQKLLTDLPKVITRPPRLLKYRGEESSETVYLSQMQCAHLMVTAFFSAFPRVSASSYTVRLLALMLGRHIIYFSTSGIQDTKPIFTGYSLVKLSHEVYIFIDWLCW